VLVEGPTEKVFVDELVRPHLYGRGYHSVDARMLGKADRSDRRGGITRWPQARSDILRHLKGDQGLLVSTLVDFYALPRGDEGWPGRAEAADLPFAGKAATLHEAVHADIVRHMDRNFRADRFVPFVVMHEFEGLLFSDCARFAEGIGELDLSAGFQAIRDAFGSPEEINDSPETAPSKRIQRLVPGYQKPLHGNLAALHIGLDAVRAECPHFNAWIERLERWPGTL
jgi:hypothetical protein